MRGTRPNSFVRTLRWTLALAALMLLAACAQIESPVATRGMITGVLAYGPTGTSLTGAAVGSSQFSTEDPSGSRDIGGFQLSTSEHSADFVPGEIIVKFQDVAGATPMSPRANLNANGVALSRTRAMALPRTGLYRAAKTDRATTLALIDALNARPDVEYAHPNFIVEGFVQPGDEYYPLMWHYSFIDLERAWDVTTGSPGPVVAVVDSGILFGHPDAPVNLLDGYDFVSDPDNPDGDGRDGDPTDPGPGDPPPEGVAPYHGSHVAGTVAAATNNDYRGGPAADGVAGSSWGATVLPVRVLGPYGDVADIVDAVIWSSGGFVPDVPDNLNPADVINLSLGGGTACINTPSIQEAVDFAASMGSIVVAAAGNGGGDAIGDDAANTTPASCTGVFTVGAWTLENDRGDYSNWGAAVDLMAPGGVLSEDVDSDGQPDGVLSLGFVDDTSTYTYVWSAGTSMATPHVSGVIALMLSANPSLTRQDLHAILKHTATPYTGSQCDAGQSVTSPNTACGAGVLDAHAAVGTSLGPSGPTVVGALSGTTARPSGGDSSEGVILDYSISVATGSNYVFGWTDTDKNGLVTTGDWFGDFPSYVEVDAGERVTDVAFTMYYVTSADEVAATLPAGVSLQDIEQTR